MVSYNFFRFPIYIVKILGLWEVNPTATSTKKVLYFLYQHNVTVILHLSTISSFIYFLINIQNIQNVSSNLCVTIVLISLSTKVQWMLVRRKNIKDFIEYVDHDAESEESREIVSINGTSFRNVLVATYINATLLLMSMILIPFITFENNYFPLRLWLPFSIETSSTYYMTYIYQVVTLIYSGYCILTLNLFVVGLISRICSEYDVLEFEINHFFQVFKDVDGIDNPTMAVEFRKIVRHHQRIIQCTDGLNRLYRLHIIVQVSGTATLLVTIGLDIILLSVNINLRLFVQMDYVCVAIVDIFLYCHFGTLIISKSENLTNVIFGSEWHGMHPVYKKNFMFMLQRSQKEPKIKIAHLFTLDRYLFLQILTNTYNMCAVMLHLTAKTDTE